jgi:hypothetical protein
MDTQTVQGSDGHTYQYIAQDARGSNGTMGYREVDLGFRTALMDNSDPMFQSQFNEGC